MHTDPNTPDAPTVIDETDAKAGTRDGKVRLVLAVSLGLAIVAMTVIWVTGALSQDDVESQMNVERRIEAQQDQPADTNSTTDGVSVFDSPTAPTE